MGIHLPAAAGRQGRPEAFVPAVAVFAADALGDDPIHDQRANFTFGLVVRRAGLRRVFGEKKILWWREKAFRATRSVGCVEMPKSRKIGRFTHFDETDESPDMIHLYRRHNKLSPCSSKRLATAAALLCSGTQR